MRREKFSVSLSLLMILAGLVTGTGCATITMKSSQRIPVTSSPPGAAVSVNGQPAGTTPLEIRLARKMEGHVVRIEAPGYHPVEVRLTRKRTIPTAAIISDAILGGLLGTIMAIFPGGGLDKVSEAFENNKLLVPAMAVGLPALDLIVGKRYAVNPKELIVTLDKADGTPRVDTIFLSADDLRNVKWIRVRKD